MSLTAFAPLIDHRATTLILGSMPGVASLEAQQYYAHPRNAFWSIMQHITGIRADAPYDLRCQGLLHHGIALWDVLAQCQRQGSLDSAIEASSMVVNDFLPFFRKHNKIHSVILNGSKANQLFKRHVSQPGLCPPTIQIQACPSTSPAHARLTLPQKIDLWLPHLPS